MKNVLVIIAVLLIGLGQSNAQTVLYSQTFNGTSFPTGFTTSGAQAANLSNNTSSSSTGYTTPTASGGGNVADGNTAPTTGTAILTAAGVISTTGYNSINIMYGARKTSAYTGVITLEWSSDGTTWNTITYTDVTNSGSWAKINGGTNITLPSGASNQGNLRFRWTFVRANTSGNYRIDDFTVYGTVIAAGTPVQFSVGIPTPTSPTVASGFSVTVSSLDNTSVAANTVANTGFTLSNTGGGTIGGTFTGTILAGSNSIVVSGITLSTAATGVTLTATRTSGDVLTTATGAAFNVLAAASQLALVSVPTTGTQSTNLTSFTVQARRPDNTVDNTYTGNITIAKASGPGNLSGTVTVAAVAGVATFSTLQFDAAGTYTIQATSGALTASTSGNIVIAGLPTLTELVVPQYMGSKTAASTNNARALFTVCLRLQNLLANTTYDIKAGLALTSDAATSYGAGNVWNGGAGFGGTAQVLNNAFTTDGSGDSGPFWITFQPTGNGTRFDAGQIHNVRLGYVIAGGSLPANAIFVGAKTITALDIANSARTGATTDDGAFIKGSACAAATGKYVLLYDNTAGTGDPLFSYQAMATTATNSTQSELPTTINDVYLQSGTAATGDYAAVIPIGANNANGVRRIESRNANNTVYASSTDADGIWPGGANTTTVARRGIATILSTDALLVPPATTPATQDNNITFGTVTSNSIQLSWTNQGAGNHLVYINTANSFTNPTDNNSYSANNVYASGLQAVYNGTSNTVTVSNLSASTPYFFRVYGYNGSICTSAYNTSTATNNPNSTSTTAPPIGITTSTGSLNFGNVVVNQTYELSYTVTAISLTNPLIITANPPFKISLTSGSGYTSSLNLGSGNIATTTIYVAFTPTAATTYSDIVANVSSGATTQNVSVTGIGLATTLNTSVSSLASYGNQIVNTSSTTPKSFTVTGTNLPSNITVTAPTGFEVCLTSGGTYTSSVTLTVTGAGNPSGGSVAGVIVYVKFHPLATVAYSDIVTVSATGATTQNVAVAGNGTPPPALTELVVPKYIGSKSAAATNNTRTPFAVCLQIDNIAPNTAYDIQLGVGLTSDAVTQLGAGNVWNGTAFSGSIVTTAFTTNASGSSGPFWIYIQPTGNGTRFGGGQIHNLRLNYRVNGGSFTANPDFVGTKTITSLDIATTALTAGTTDDGAFVKGSSFACSASKYILLYDNVAGTGDPLYSYQSRTSTATNITQSELPTAINDVFLQTGTSTTGDFAAVIPIGANNTNGVRRVEARNANNTFFAASTDADGVWPSGANSTTIGRRGVVTLTSADIPLSTSTASISGTQTICNTQAATLTIIFTGTAPYTYSYTDGVTTYGPFTTSSTSVSPTVSPSSDKTYTISAANDANCTAVTSGSAVVTVTPTPTWYLDADNDGHYVSSPVTQCTSPGAGYNITATSSGDCNDNDNTKWQSGLLYIDIDNDDYDNGTATVCYGASIPSGYSTFTLGTDCNDNNALLTTVCSTVSYTWTGTTNTQWTVSTNWTPVAPSGGPNGSVVQVTIPAAPTGSVFPQLTSPKIVGNIIMQGSATLDITALNSLTVTGNWTGGIGALVTGTGLVIFKNGIIAHNLLGKTRFNNLRLDDVLGATISGGATQIYSVLELKTGQLTVSNPAYLTLVSTSVTQCAIINDFSPNTYNGTIAGSITAQRYVAGTGNIQHQLGLPVSTNLSSIGAGAMTGYSIPKPTCTETLLASNSPYGNVYRWDENNPASCILEGWFVMAGSSAAQAGRGYSVYVNGTTTLNVTGAPNLAATYAMPGLTNSNYNLATLESSPSYTFESGWHLLCNPFPSGYTYTAQPGFAANGFVYVPSGPYTGTYQPLTPGTVLAPFASIMLFKTLGGTATYSFTKANRSTNGNSVFLQNNNAETLNIEIAGNGFNDATQLAFNAATTNQFDADFDLRKQRSNLGQPTLFTGNNSFPYAINTQTSVAQTATVPMGVIPGANGTYTITINGVNSFDPTSYIWLEDKVTGMMQNVRTNNTYTFTMTNTEDVNRFVLHFTPAAEVTNTDATCSTPGTISVIQQGDANWQYAVTDNNGVVVGSGNLNNTNPIMVSAVAGVYTLTLVDANNYTVVKQIQLNGVQPVQSSFDASSNTVQQNDDVVFTSTATTATTHTWSFGDGTTANGVLTSHSYTTPGVYTVTLTADNADCNAMSTQQITVTQATTTGINTITDNKGIAIWSHNNTVFVDMSKQPNVDAQIEIYNVLGQQLSNEKFGRSTIYSKAFSNLEAAYVIVRVKNNDEITTKKVFIKN